MTFRPRKNKQDDEREFDRLVAQETLILETTEEICRVLNSENITRTELAKRLGKSKGFVTQVLSGERNMTLNTVADFAFALGHHFQVQAVRDKTAIQSQGPLDTMPPTLQSNAPLAFVRFEDSDYGSRLFTEASRSTIDAEAWRSTTPCVPCEDTGVDPHDHEFTLAA